jgi:hypothetical protein
MAEVGWSLIVFESAVVQQSGLGQTFLNVQENQKSHHRTELTFQEISAPSSHNA